MHEMNVKAAARAVDAQFRKMMEQGSGDMFAQSGWLGGQEWVRGYVGPNGAFGRWGLSRYGSPTADLLDINKLKSKRMLVVESCTTRLIAVLRSLSRGICRKANLVSNGNGERG
ncbi:hypothetical protein LTR28_007941 [Elasticomyces elasticus]|nr:hypothetical protein LTR28_007941 [Elasticomyces elasticus]